MLGKLCRLEKQCGHPPAHPEKLPTRGVVPGAPKPVKAFMNCTSPRASEPAMLTRCNGPQATLSGDNNGIVHLRPSSLKLGKNRALAAARLDHQNRYVRLTPQVHAPRRSRSC
jgi:hypothetical protein